MRKNYFNVERLFQAMKETGATEEDILQAIQKEHRSNADKSKKLWTSIIEGKKDPTLHLLKTICDIVNVSADFLIDLKEEMY